MQIACGGVVVNDKGQVLLREPANHFDGYVWTFPKGRSEPGETEEETALREVMEETGVKCSIVSRIPGMFKGGTTQNIYFLMRPIDGFADFDQNETQSIKWASIIEAKSLIAQTTNEAGRERDLEVLKAVEKIFGVALTNK